MKSLYSGQQFPHYKTMWAIGKVLKDKQLQSQQSDLAIIWTRPRLYASHVCKSLKNPIKTMQAMLRTSSNMVFFGTLSNFANIAL